MNQKKLNVRVIAFVGMLGALAGVLAQLDFSVPLAPSFLKFDFADLPALFAGFFLGPVEGCLTEVIKIVIKLMFKPTTTAYVGELSNLVGSCCFVLTAALIYTKKRSKKGAVIALVSATLLVSAVQVVLNIFVMFPLYSKLYHMTMDKIIAMGTKVNPLIKDYYSMMAFGVLPFNLLKHGVTSFITYLVYKRSASMLRKILHVEARKLPEQK